LSKLEVIQYVIDYICDLQSALETHPAVSTFDAAAALGQKKNRKRRSARDNPWDSGRVPTPFFHLAKRPSFRMAR
jgi:hypothetical protein